LEDGNRREYLEEEERRRLAIMKRSLGEMREEGGCEEGRGRSFTGEKRK
jgi:hypothetical protein